MYTLDIKEVTSLTMTTATKNKVCEMCGGEGEVRTMEQVWAGEPHMADIGSAPCPECSPPKNERDEDDYY